MKRTILAKLATVVALTVAILTASATATAFAQGAPSAKDMAEAKKAFAEGKKLHEAGKLPQAVEKFQKSYFLSKNPLLLYNIGITMEEAGMEDLAVGYYKKFLSDAPAEAAQRPDVTERLQNLEKKLGGGGTTTTEPGTKPPGTRPPPTSPDKPVVVKPAGTYAETDFQHEVVEAAPPGKPLDVTAYVPEDSGWVVTLNFRTAGEGKFTSKAMKWRYKELVGRVPAPKMIGDAVQYYVEVKDSAGTVITRSGKATSPNLVTIEAGATARFYPDVTDEGETKVTSAQIKARDDSDDPLGTGSTTAPDDEAGPVELQPTVAPGTGFSDTSSSKFKYAKIGTTIATGALLGASLVFYIQAGRNASALEADSTMCGTPPCRQFDEVSAGYEDGGKLNDKLSKITLGIGAVTAVAAGYFWYKSLTAKKRGDMKATTGASGSSPESASATWVVLPTLGSGFAGAAAAVEF